MQSKTNTQIEYEEAYKEWLSTMTEEELETLKELNLLTPDRDHALINTHRCSIEDNVYISDKHTEELETETTERGQSVAAVLLRLKDSPNPMLYLDVLLNILNLNSFGGVSLSEIGRRHGVTRQRVSNLRVQILDTFNLSISNGTRPNTRVHRPCMVGRKYTQTADTFRRNLFNLLRNNPIDTWPEVQLYLIRDELTVFAKLFRELSDEINKREQG